MRYLLNYKGTTLPFQADRVKNCLLSSCVRFSYPSIQRGDIQQCWRIHCFDKVKWPAHQMPITIQKTEMNRSNRRSRNFPQHEVHKGETSGCFVQCQSIQSEQTWYTHVCTLKYKHGQSSAAAWAHSNINLHPAEICEAGRLRGGRWCRLFWGRHLGSMMLSYVPAAGRGEASTYKMVVNLH